MNVLWIHAHPEPRSLGGMLAAEGRRALVASGHAVTVSDLYAMRWNPVVDAADFGHDPACRLHVGAASRRAYDAGELSADIAAEQEKLRWADAVVLQFPLWWLGPPAILKGWLDRVLVHGFGFGVTDPATGRVRRYGDGELAGKRGLVVTTIGARESSFGPRGIHGHLDDVLFPLHHGVFWYTGMEALPPLAVYGADRADEGAAGRAVARLRDRLAGLACDEPLPFRSERGGDYDADLVLRPGLGPGRSGPALHYR
ncbi:MULTISPECIES: NAD(P)H-dependent oxidoreductase [Prauserella salsuginis group]|uniref:NAD(P)H-dependent oxidoreductase n=1 Tax=Prauserella salsuginis TaxID=387889 RepID=A0ABW6G3B2_9PSEU|nr:MULTISPECIES: NAD(P)H-dependent oxidoreductase [Prauserella salsuginis group]MCR3718578.1 NAD(P)H dehydrogenase (quinone) [Prauserella flava]MCR3733148.1 NAD(P)H dehydrogenase (quinone) [Prauserella salsuginis]